MEAGRPMDHGSTVALDDALATLADTCAPLDRAEQAALAAADGRVLAAPVTAARAVPQYDRVSRDGWAVQAAETAGAGTGSPTRLEPADAEVTAGTAVRVHDGAALPDGADAVLPVEAVDRRMEGLAVYEAVQAGANVEPAGSEIPAGEPLFEAGRRLAPAALALCGRTGVAEVPVVDRPRVAVVTPGEGLAADDAEPAPRGPVPTTGRLLAQSGERWGATAAEQTIVPPTVDDLVEALATGAAHDLLVTTGGAAVEERAPVPAALREVGEVLVHGVHIDPGHATGIGTVAGADGTATPVLLLPDAPDACLVAAVQLLRPAIGLRLGTDLPVVPRTTGTLRGAVPSDVGTRTFVRVRLAEADGPDRPPEVEPLETGRPGSHPEQAATDGWIEVPDSAGRLAAGTSVTVQHWSASQ